MELLLIILPFAAALLTLLAWSAWRGREPAAMWWIGAAVVLCAAAVLSTSGVRAALELAPGGPLGPLGAWLLYRGCVEFAGGTPTLWLGALAIIGSVGWLGFNAAGWLESARYIGPVSELPLCITGAAVLARRSTTPIQRLLAAGIALVAIAALLDPWLRGASGGSPPGAIFVWISVVFPTALFGVCALLERGTQRTTEELRDREHQLAEAQRIAHVGSWSFDLESGELQWSDEKFRIHGYEPGSIHPFDALRAGIMGGADRAAVESGVARAIEAGDAVDTEISFVRADGEPARVLGHSSLVCGPDGRRRVLGVTLDVTDRRRAEEEIERHRAHLEDLVSERTAQLEASMQRLRRSERLASLGTLAAGIAHQINNPVASILASAQLARRQEGSPEERAAAQKALRDIEREAHRCGEIAHGVLKFASARATERRSQPLGPVLERAVKTTQSYASSRGAAIHFDGPLPDVEIEMSAIDIEQAIVNLLRNGIEAKGHGAAVRLSCSEKNDQVVIHVDDDGRGIPSAHLQQVFDPFFTQGKDAGTGLGLSIAHGVATEHGGSLWIESREHFGTRVALALPVRRSADSVPG